MMQKAKDAYLLWHGYHALLPKTHRYSLGNRIDELLIQTIEAIAAASFLVREEKIPEVRHAIRGVDALKILLLMLWETKSLDTKKYAALSEKIDEMGRMLGGWYGQIMKQNSSGKPEEK